jgi:serine/threonine protein phosphatase PrpC
VFDGHGGYKAAQYCKENLLQTIIKDSEFERNPAQAVFNSFYKYDIFLQFMNLQKLIYISQEWTKISLQGPEFKC